MVDIRRIGITDTGYPTLLRQIYDPPRRLYLQGALPEFNQCTLAVAGGSRATPESRTAARALGRYAAENGVLLVTDGMSVHAREASAGARVVGGLQLVVQPGPPETAETAEGMSLLWELPARRDLGFLRIIAGLSCVVCLVDAPWSLRVRTLTECALEEGRDVVVHSAGKGRRGSKTLADAGAEVLSSSQRLSELLAAW